MKNTMLLVFILFFSLEALASGDPGVRQPESTPKQPLTPPVDERAEELSEALIDFDPDTAFGAPMEETRADTQKLIDEQTTQKAKKNTNSLTHQAGLPVYNTEAGCSQSGCSSPVHYSPYPSYPYPYYPYATTPVSNICYAGISYCYMSIPAVVGTPCTCSFLQFTFYGSYWATVPGFVGY